MILDTSGDFLYVCFSRRFRAELLDVAHSIKDAVNRRRRCLLRWPRAEADGMMTTDSRNTSRTELIEEEHNDSAADSAASVSKF